MKIELWTGNSTHGNSLHYETLPSLRSLCRCLNQLHQHSVINEDV